VFLLELFAFRFAERLVNEMPASECDAPGILPGPAGCGLGFVSRTEKVKGKKT